MSIPKFFYDVRNFFGKIHNFFNDLASFLRNAMVLFLGIVGSIIVICLCIISIPFLGIYILGEHLFCKVPVVRSTVVFWLEVFGFEFVES